MAVAAAVFVALVAVRNLGFWGYWLSHPSALDLRSVETILSRDVLSAAAVLFFDGLVWSLGRRFIRAPGLLGHVTAFAIGLGTAATTFFLGALWSLTAAFAFLATAFLAARPAPIAPAIPKRSVLSPTEGVLCGLLAFALFNALAQALAPPTDWDVLAYHLAIPRIYFRAGKVVELPWLLHSHWPHLMEVLYAAPLAMGRDNAAALIHLSACVALVLAVFGVAEESLGRRAAWIAAVLLAAQPAFAGVSGVAHSDGVLALFTFLVGATLAGGRDRGRLAAGAVLAGFGAATKLHGAVLLVLWGLPIAWTFRRERGGWRSAALFYAVGAAVAAPWYLKTWLAMGSPVWPFFGGRFGGARIASALAAENRWHWPADAALIWRYGPQFMIAPVAVLLWVLRKERLPAIVKWVLAPAPLYALLVWDHHEAWRFLLPFLPGLALGAAWAIARAPRALAVGALGLGLSPLLFLSQNNQLFAVAALRSASFPGRDPRELYLERSLDHYGFYRAAAALLKPTDKVLLWREIRGYYLDADYQWGDPLVQRVLPYDELPDTAALSVALRRQGVTAVLVNENLGMYRPGATYYGPRECALMDGILARGRRLLSGGGLALYAVD